MPTFNRILEGGRSVSGNSGAPRSRRGNQTAQADIYWSGLTPSGGAAYPVEFFAVGGGGGGGAGFNNGSTSANGGTGGGGGGSQTAVMNRVAGIYTITVGTGGMYGNYPSPNGSTGGTSSVTDPSNNTVCTASGGGGGQSNANPATNGAGGSGTTWTGGSGNLTGGTTNGWTGSSVTYSTSGQAGVGNGNTNPGDVGVGGTSGGGNPFAGSYGMNGSTFMRIPSNFASKVLATTGSPTVSTSGSYTFYKWTSSGTVTLLP
jgi:hypothetical protein